MYHNRSTQETHVSVQLQQKLLNYPDTTVKQFARLLYILASKGIHYPVLFIKDDLKDLLKPYSFGRKYFDERLHKATIEHEGETMPLIHKLYKSEWRIENNKVIITPKFPQNIEEEIYINNKVLLPKIKELTLWILENGGKKGRPPNVYTIFPYWVYSQFFNIRAVPYFVDIADHDLRSMKRYRARLQGEFIADTPGQHSREYLGKRIGVSKCTTRNYDKLNGTVIKPNYEEYNLSDEADFEFYCDRFPWGYLKDEDGRRYPLNLRNYRAIKKKGQGVTFVRRTSNDYYPPGTDLSTLDDPGEPD